jgi:hypothetical protein
MVDTRFRLRVVQRLSLQRRDTPTGRLDREPHLQTATSEDNASLGRAPRELWPKVTTWVCDVSL